MSGLEPWTLPTESQPLSRSNTVTAFRKILDQFRSRYHKLEHSTGIICFLSKQVDSLNRLNLITVVLTAYAYLHTSILFQVKALG